MNVNERLEEIIRQLVNDDAFEFQDDTMLDQIPGWDSIVQINLMFALEQQLGVRFSGSEIFEFETFGQLKRFVAANASGAELSHKTGR
jgi:acyl carrier protein